MLEALQGEITPESYQPIIDLNESSVSIGKYTFFFRIHNYQDHTGTNKWWEILLKSMTNSSSWDWVAEIETIVESGVHGIISSESWRIWKKEVYNTAWAIQYLKNHNITHLLFLAAFEFAVGWIRNQWWTSLTPVSGDRRSSNQSQQQYSINLHAADVENQQIFELLLTRIWDRMKRKEDKGRICIELIETAHGTQFNQFKKNIKKLNKLWFALALDDFPIFDWKTPSNISPWSLRRLSEQEWQTWSIKLLYSLKGSISRIKIDHHDFQIIRAISDSDQNDKLESLKEKILAFREILWDQVQIVAEGIQEDELIDLKFMEWIHMMWFTHIQIYPKSELERKAA